MDQKVHGGVGAAHSKLSYEQQKVLNPERRLRGSFELEESQGVCATGCDEGEHCV